MFAVSGAINDRAWDDALPKCTIKDGETNGVFLLFVPEHGGPHHAIQLQSSHVSLSDFLKVARSFTKLPK